MNEQLIWKSILLIMGHQYFSVKFYSACIIITDLYMGQIIAGCCSSNLFEELRKEYG